MLRLMAWVIALPWYMVVILKANPPRIAMKWKDRAPPAHAAAAAAAAIFSIWQRIRIYTCMGIAVKSSPMYYVYM